MKTLISIVVTFCQLLSSNSNAVSPLSVLSERPKLVVVISIDQFRSDYLTRFESRFLKPKKKGEITGFHYLMSEGAYFPYGQYEILQNMTGAGHATILTGSYPYRSGIPINYWFDSEKQVTTYCTGDDGKKIVGGEGNAPGMSPKNLIGTTVGDELKNAGYASKVVSISIKDRASILMGGHRADLALWLDGRRARWVTSRHYLPTGELPDWVSGLNKALSTFKESENIDAALATPFGNEITIEAAKKAIEALKLGQGKDPDLLALSFSSHDYLGHARGPNSTEMDEMVLAEDRLFAKFFTYLNKQVPGGLKNILIVLTADHGIAPVPEPLNKNGIAAGRINEEKWKKELNEFLIKKLGQNHDDQWISSWQEMNIYFNPKLIGDRKIDREKIYEATKQFFREKSEIAFTFSEKDFRERKLPPGADESAILKTFHPGRSGDVIAIVKPFFLISKEGTTHFTHYSYDRTVPILFAGSQISSGVYARPAGVVDIAPTLTFLLGTIPPALSEGRVLEEILISKRMSGKSEKL